MITTRSSSRLFIPSLLLTLLLAGCGSKGVKLEGFVPSDGGGPSLTMGDGGTCTSAPCTSGAPADWNDSFITPNAVNSFTVAMKSAKLIKQGDTSPSYTIFDSGDIAKPVIQSFSPGTTQTFGTNTDFPVAGTYDKIQYVISYYEMVVPILYPGLTQFNADRRVRLYLGSFNDPSLGQVVQKDILIGDTLGNLQWINPTKGLGDFIPSRSNQISVLQVPTSQLEVTGGVDTPVTDPYTFTFSLAPPLVISGSPDNQFVIRLTFDTTKIFFFDETNGAGVVDPKSASTNTNFNPSLVHCTTNGSGFTNAQCDGRLDATPPANFWPGLPAVTAERK